MINQKLKYLMLFVVVFFTSIWFSEYYNVGITGQTEEYPWGLINNNSWFYETPILYTKVIIIEFLISLYILLFLIYALVKRKDNLFNYGIALFVIFIHDTIINSNISFLR